MQRHSHPLTLKSVIAALLPVVLASCMVAQTAPAQPPPKPGRMIPPVWTPSYNAEQGPLPDTSDWPVVMQGKHLVVRLAPGSDWSQYREVAAGEVRYTGSEIKLTPRQIAQLTDLLQMRLGKDLRLVKLSPAPGASGKLKVNANITEANAIHRMPNLAYMAGEVGRASVTAWVLDDSTQQPVASIEMTGSGKRYARGVDFLETGETRMVLREESRMIARVLNAMGQAATVQKKDSK